MTNSEIEIFLMLYGWVPSREYPGWYTKDGLDGYTQIAHAYFLETGRYIESILKLETA